MTTNLSVEEFISKVQASRQGTLDLSSDEDLSIAIMNLISLEEHFFFTAQKTDKPSYLDFLYAIREMRKTLLKKLIVSYEGEVWCIGKHLLSASMRLMEVGTKALSAGQKYQAQGFFKQAFELYSLFWAVVSNQIDGTVTKVVPTESEVSGTVSLSERFKAIVKKAIDCCKE